MKAGSPSLRVAVLISGSGSNLQAMIDSREAGTLDIDIATVISNQPQAYGLRRAREAGIDAQCLPHREFHDRKSFDNALAELLKEYRVDLVLLAGFMRILTPEFVAEFEGRLLNIHPSLLPLYPGLDTHRRALEAGDAWHGSTVHFVSEELDGGPPIIQGRVRVERGDKPETLAQRVLKVEHLIYPRAVQLITEGRVRYADRSAWLDGERMTEPLQFETL
ncbi:MAG: phosphoribosylglycinamide formyltransferase [Woeseiaceae bacterium]